MRVFLLMLLIYPFPSYASGSGDCPGIMSLTKSLYIYIHPGCGDGYGGDIQFTHEMDDKGHPIINTIKMFPMEKECVLNISELACHSKGLTPLAGATFKLKQAGTYIHDCGEIGTPIEMPRMRYTCISGCGKSVPKYLDRDDLCD
ncbi:MAG: hypothetical protein ABIS30_00465 [Gallionella sp.]|jgi:hypothetical protein